MSDDTSSPRLSAAMAVMLTAMVGYFIFWGMGYTNNNHTLLFTEVSPFLVGQLAL